MMPLLITGRGVGPHGFLSLELDHSVDGVPVPEVTTVAGG